MAKYQKYAEYKDSGVEWLEDVPREWDIIKIKHLSTVKRGASPRPIDDPKYFDDNGEYAWVRIADVSASDMYLLNTTQTMSDLGSSLSVKLEPNQLFLSIAGTVGKPCINKIKACIHDGFVYFPELKIPNKYLFYVFAGEQAYKGLGKMGTQLNLNTDTVGDIKVALPKSQSDIYKIIEFLDHETAKIDSLIAKQEKLIELLKEKRQAVISHAVTKGLDPNVQMKDSGVEWLGEVPEHWTKSKLVSVADGTKGCFVNGPFGSDLLANELRDEGVPVVYIRDIKPTGYKRKSTVHVTEQKARQLEICNVKVDDVIISKVGDPPGDACLYPKGEPDAIVTQDVIRIRVDRSRFNPKFIVYLLNSDFGRLVMDNISVEGTRKRVSLGDFKDTRFVFPPLKEQELIVENLNSACKSIDLIIARAIHGIGLIQERRTALISAAVTGKIDVRNWQAPTVAEADTELSA
ncbi:restriction endonuclease subunit S [Acinetobacter pittii]|uniref:restriction endonuclease subunit S n=1 Tax=Acinetobacter pittii TaxID=48296 RepID=UPI002447ED67|nr:restriction endonuclease subunit S [Acinetobacter pittii]MDH0694473.1 restriction endonuclease subunit S [Acinetobacter pittii]